MTRDQPRPRLYYWVADVEMMDSTAALSIRSQPTKQTQRFSEQELYPH